MTIAALVVTDENNAVGKNSQFLNYLPAYLKYFDSLTKGSAIIMGRKTFESIGDKVKGKKNIVVTRSHNYKVKGAEVHYSIDSALKSCQKERKVFVIGGADVFRQTLHLTTVIYRTCIKARFKADNYYPHIDTDEFDLESAECILADKENRFDYCIEKWIRTKSADKK
jgi:dihydrofolate reductase